jgi:hypothetical protein
MQDQIKLQRLRAKLKCKSRLHKQALEEAKPKPPVRETLCRDGLIRTFRQVEQMEKWRNDPTNDDNTSENPKTVPLPVGMILGRQYGQVFKTFDIAYALG